MPIVSSGSGLRIAQERIDYSDMTITAIVNTYGWFLRYTKGEEGPDLKNTLSKYQ